MSGEEPTQITLQPKLVEAENRLMISDDDYVYLNSFKPEAIMRGVAGFVIPFAGTFALLKSKSRVKSAVVTLPLCFGALGATFGVASIFPKMARECLLMLPPESPLKVVLLELAQRNNPELNPQQIFSLTHRYQQQRGLKVPDNQ